jgi:hypothetical protein
MSIMVQYICCLRNLKNAYNSVIMEVLYSILSKLGRPRILVGLINMFK